MSDSKSQLSGRLGELQGQIQELRADTAMPLSHRIEALRRFATALAKVARESHALVAREVRDARQ
jgi:hypothetical protein